MEKIGVYFTPSGQTLNHNQSQFCQVIAKAQTNATLYLCQQKLAAAKPISAGVPNLECGKGDFIQVNSLQSGERQPQEETESRLPSNNVEVPLI